ncbi:hypothetical protein J437_LFUL007713 [Ladona fulva]|uniref:Chloride channel CLIC-like protein 1 n=1 Tax=Ladona fulva TaxID=123851 RepID=A0A8K0K5X6_LADFU|nr:hypothetical protein J437_LFUL007713 [Ladona fulva]
MVFLEETIKSHSEQLRLANIPEHCHGIDNRSWWEKAFRVKPEDKECYEHHYHRLSRPNLRVSYYKAFLNLFGPFLEMIISSIRALFAGDKDQWFFSNWVFQVIMIPTFFLFLIFIITIYRGGSVRFPLFSFGGVSANPPIGSHVQCLATVEKPKPPPRLKNGRKRKETDEADGSSPSSTFVFNIKGGSLNLNMSEPLPVVKKKELLFTSKKEECESQHTPSTKDQVSERGETDLSSEESDVEAESEDLECNIEDGKGNISAAENDHLAGGDTNIVAEKVLQTRKKEK